MSPGPNIRRALIRTLLVLGSLTAGLLGVLALGPTVQAGFLQSRVEEALSEQLGVRASIDTLWITIGFRAGAEVQGLEAGGLQLERARIELGLRDLLRKRLKVHRIDIEGLRADTKEWSADKITQPETRPETDSEWTLVSIDSAVARDISLSIGRGDNAQPLSLQVSAASLGLTPEDPMELSVEGTLAGTYFSGQLRSEPLPELLESQIAPVTGIVSVGDVDIEIQGQADLTTSPWSVSADVDLSAQSLSSLGKILKTDLPNISPFRAAAQIALDDSTVTLERGDLRLGRTTAHADLSIALEAGAPSALSGRLTLDVFDLDPWMGTEPLTLTEVLETDLTGLSEGLDLLTASLEFEVSRLVGLPLEVTDITASLDLSGGRLALPLAGRVGDSSFSGAISLHETEEQLGTDLELLATNVRLVSEDGLERLVGQTQIRASGRGATGAELLSTLDLDLEMRELTLDYTGDEQQMVKARVDWMKANRRGNYVSLRARGRLAETPVEIEGGFTIPERPSREEAWMFDFSGHGPSTTIHLDGALVPRAEDPSIDSRFQVQGSIPADPSFTLDLRGSQGFSDNRLRIVLDEGHFGNTDVAGEFVSGEVPRLHLRSSQLDLAQLTSLLSGETEAVERDGQLNLGVTILPAGIELKDADIGIEIDRLKRPVAVQEDVRVALRVRDGRLLPSEFSFRDGPTPLAGTLSLDLLGSVPALHLGLEAQHVDLGGLLHRHGLAENLRGEAESLELALVARGSSLRDLLTRSELRLTARNMGLSFGDSATGKVLEMTLARASWNAAQDQPATLDLTGTIRDVPLEVGLEVAAWEEQYLDLPLPVRANATIGNTSLLIDTEAVLPFQLLETWHRFELNGEDLFSVTEQDKGRQFQTGPFQLSGRVRATSESLALEELTLTTGSSSVDGSGLVRRTSTEPQIELNLSSDLFILEDFLASDIGAQVEEAIVEATIDENQYDVTADPAEAVNWRAVLRSGQADIDVNLEKIVLDGEVLGEGRFSLALEQGVLHLDSASVLTGGGSTLLGIQLDGRSDQMEGVVRANLEDFDVHQIVDGLEIEAFSGGRLSLDMEASFAGATTTEALASTNGHLNATYYPADADGRLLDLWGGPLFQAALPSSGAGRSMINCLVGWFTIDQGVMTPNALFLDTHRMRASGKGSIDLASRELSLKLSPRPKNRNLLNLATPVRIKGTWDEPSIRFVSGGLLGTLLRIQLWTITVWRDVTRSPLPLDGRDVCVPPPA